VRGCDCDCGPCVINGEVVVCDEDGLASFDRIRHRDGAMAMILVWTYGFLLR
jgi:ATP-dependent DNA ligase